MLFMAEVWESGKGCGLCRVHALSVAYMRRNRTDAFPKGLKRGVINGGMNGGGSRAKRCVLPRRKEPAGSRGKWLCERGETWATG